MKIILVAIALLCTTNLLAECPSVTGTYKCPESVWKLLDSQDGIVEIERNPFGKSFTFTSGGKSTRYPELNWLLVDSVTNGDITTQIQTHAVCTGNLVKLKAKITDTMNDIDVHTEEEMRIKGNAQGISLDFHIAGDSLIKVNCQTQE